VCADPREDVWGGTDMGPRLPLDAAKSLGREMYLDRSRQFASIMQRLDELERLGVCAGEHRLGMDCMALVLFSAHYETGALQGATRGRLAHKP